MRLSSSLLLGALAWAAPVHGKPEMTHSQKMARAVEASSDQQRRVFLHYKTGKRESCSETIQGENAARDKTSSIQVHYDIPKLNAFVVTATNAEIDKMASDPDVDRVVEDPVRKLFHTQRRRLLEWPGQATPYGIGLIGADLLKGEGLTGEGIKVCVIDSGLDLTHEDFNTTAITGDSLQDIVISSSLEWSVDQNGHGTLVAGVVAAANNNLGVVGVAPDASLHIVNALGQDGVALYSSVLIDALGKCRDAGSRIINMSLGGSVPSPEEEQIIMSLYEDDGIISIAAVGNEGSRVTQYPAGYSDVIAVGAVDRQQAITDFSTFNERVDLTAPGLDIWSTLPMNFDCEICSGFVASDYTVISGTSLSAPHVAGVAAQLWSYNTAATAPHIVNALLASALDLGIPGRDDNYGHGMVQGMEALRVLQSTLNGEDEIQDWTDPPPSDGVTGPTEVIPTCKDNEYLVKVDVRTDRYGNETFWEIVRNVDDFTVGAGAGLTARNKYVTYLCLPENCYDFTIHDSFEDGMCCGFGQGEFSLMVDGSLLLSGGEFTDSVSVEFGTCIELSTDPKPELPPCANLTMNLLTDSYPTEISVSLTDTVTGNVFWTDERFFQQLFAYKLTECIDPTSCYEFLIEDSSADGICCSYGSGNVELVYEEQVIFSAGSYTSSISHRIGEACSSTTSNGAR